MQFRTNVPYFYWRVQIQEYLTASLQNILILTSHVKEQRPAWANRVRGVNPLMGINLLTQFFRGGLLFAYPHKPVLF
jgi:hypothetical protein